MIIVTFVFKFLYPEDLMLGGVLVLVYPAGAGKGPGICKALATPL